MIVDERTYNFRNNNPSTHTFKNTFRSLLITRFIKFHSDSYNCEEDSGDQLLKWKTLFEAQKDDVNLYKSLESSNFPSSNIQSTPSQSQTKSAKQERLAVHSRAYTAGWVLKKIMPKIRCKNCERNVYSKENEANTSINEVNMLIKYKEYNKISNKLTYPAESAVRAFGIINLEANKYLEERAHDKDVIKNLKNILKSRNLFASMGCDEHREALAEHFMVLTLRLTVFNWCNIINKILKGTDISRLENKSLPNMQNKAFVKYKTKLKNKKLNK